MSSFEEMLSLGFGRSPSEEAELDEFLRLLIMHEAITTYFQPIVDLTMGSVFGYEIVARGRPPLELPDDLFPRAKRLGLGLDFELLCIRATFRKLKSLSPEQRGRCKYFVNLTSAFMTEPGLAEELSRSNLGLYNLDESMVVLEFGETGGHTDSRELGRAIREFARSGFSVALDDYGCGNASLLNLLEVRPQFLKLDRQLVRHIHLDPYRQHLIKSVVSFASSVEARLVAEGVEYWEELDCLMRLGVRYVQGFLFGMPESEPLVPSVNIMNSMQDRVKRFQYARMLHEETIAGLITSSHMVAKDCVTCAELGELFQANAHLDHVVIIEGGRPTGMLTRQHFFAQTTGPYGFPLFQTQRIDTFAKRDLLFIEDHMALELLTRLAMDRLQESLYDPVLVVDDARRYQGTITMKALFTRSYEMGLRRALDTNPLTGLPGNRALERWIIEALQSPVYTVIYADLDRFKEYNDVYGFLAGDDMIRLTGKVLSSFARRHPGDVRLGHVGGDDFILVAYGQVQESSLREVADLFDRERLPLFKTDHVRDGGYASHDRQGSKAKVPLVTLSIAVINGSSSAGMPAHPSLLSLRAADVKKKVKELSARDQRSSWFIDRRAFPSESESAASRIQIESCTPLPFPEREDEHQAVAGFLRALDEELGDWAARPE